MVRKKGMTEDEFRDWFNSQLIVADSGCWEWTLGRSQDGYGKVKRLGRMIPTHKWMLEHSLGRPLGMGMVTRHMCHNRLCCNPDHLAEGTPLENVMDRVQAGRSIGPRGETQGHSKLTTPQVLDIKRTICIRTDKELAQLYGVNRTCIARIRNGTRWAHIIP
jgi:hypothetical protein